MTAVYYELPASRMTAAGATNSHKRVGIVFGAASESDALTTFLADSSVPVTYSVTANGVTFNFIRDTASATPKEDGSDPPQTWDVECQYQLLGYSQQKYQTGEQSQTFEIGFASTNIKQALSEASYLAGGGTAPGLNGAINVTGPTEVQGVDVDVPVYTFTETWYMAASAITTAYKSALWAVAMAPVNNVPWRIFAAGECRFLGVQGTQRNNGGDYELGFKFAASQNFTDLFAGTPLATLFSGVQKKGWQYAWPYYLPTKNTTGAKPALLPNPTAVYVNDIYKTSDFTTLGIGS